MSKYTKEEQAANRAKWVAALRSGKYQQVRGCLMSHTGQSYCCLGVACEVSGLGEFELIPDGDACFKLPDYSSPYTNFLPGPVAEWLGLRSLDSKGLLKVTIEGINNLVGLNDSACYTFEQIAEVIEQGKLMVEE